MVLHELALERRNLHGHFSRELEPVLEIESGESIAVATLDAGWGLEPPRADGSQRDCFEPRDPELDDGHALSGPVAVRGARVGQVLEGAIDSVRVGASAAMRQLGASLERQPTGGFVSEERCRPEDLLIVRSAHVGSLDRDACSHVK